MLVEDGEDALGGELVVDDGDSREVALNGHAHIIGRHVGSDGNLGEDGLVEDFLDHLGSRGLEGQEGGGR